MSVLKTSTLTLTLLLAAGGLQARSGGGLFPEPFVVEHHLVQTDADGDVYAGEPVTDTYGGSWIVSQRGDGSRVVIDLARREITEIRPAEGVYHGLSFDRFAELRSEIARFEAGFPSAESAKALAAAEPAEEPEFEVTESPGGTLKARTSGLPESANALLANPGVRHLRVELRSAASESMDVWCDADVKLTPGALVALERFELEVLGAPSWLGSKRVPAARFLAAARRHAAGAVPIRTVRPIDLGAPGPEKTGGAGRGTVEDVTVRLERLEAFPLELVEVPDGLRRTAHPMEAMAAFAEKEEERERIMGQPVDGQATIDE